MNEQLLFNQFHFLRPEWLLAMIPAMLLALFFWRQKNSAINWRSAINPQLLDHLIDGGTQKAARWPWLVLLLAWLITAIAMAGPTWTKLPQPIHKKQDALVIVLDLSLSMLAEDIKPSRLIRARHKILDILAQRDEGLTALIAYSGDAHIVSPLTDDNPTIANLTPALAPGMMPVFGSDPVAALKLAKQLFKNAGASNGRVLLLTDGVTENDVDDIDNLLKRSGYELSIMGVGTTDGAPIPAKSGFLKDNNGNIIVPQLQRSRLEDLAKHNRGRYTDISLNDNDVTFLLPKLSTELEENTVLTEREFDQWHDRGPLLALALLPLALLAFRRGWLLVIPLIVLQPQTGHAFEWKDLWERPDQQAAKALEKGDAKTAANLFNDEQWKASANYQAGDFENAAKQFARQDTATGHYNRGNALAKAGKLDEAIAAYDKALEQTPSMEDAEFNKQLLEQLKQQQEQQQQSSEGDQQDQEQQDSEQEDQQQGDQQSDQQSQEGDQQESDQQSDQNQQGEKDEQESEQKSEESAEQSEQEKEKQQQEQQAQQGEEEQQQEKEQQQAQASEQDPQSQQQKQAMEQWLRQIPDDPSGLLRRKFNYESKVRQQQGETQREQPQW